MSSKRTHRTDAPDQNSVADELMKAMFEHGKAQFGSAVKSFWFYDGQFCPACLRHEVGKKDIKGGAKLAINGFIYRPRGVLIGYLLCETCATYIHTEAQKNPYKETPMHAEIESNLIEAYQKHLMSLDA